MQFRPDKKDEEAAANLLIKHGIKDDLIILNPTAKWETKLMAKSQMGGAWGYPDQRL